jgi:putative DNA primase/helicase
VSVAGILSILDAARPFVDVAASSRAADQAAPNKQRRRRASAGDRISSAAAARAEDVAADPAAAGGDDSASSFLSDPAPPANGGKTNASSQTGGSAETPSSGGAGRRPPAGLDDDAFNRRLAFFPLTDLGNAERFHARYKDLLLFCTALGWLAWDGRRWSLEGAEELVKIAEHDTVRAIQKEAAAVRDSGRKDVPDAARSARDYLFDEKKGLLYSDKIASWGRSSEAVNKLGALSKRGAPYFAVSIDRLDADKMKFNVANGTLSVARKADGDSITFGPHDPADLITKLSRVTYDPDAQCPEYDTFLAQMQPREQMRRFLHQWGGYSMTGDVTEQLLAFFYGKGGNGKSLLVDLWSMVAGDYGETVPIETFLEQNKQRSGGQATPDLAILPGKRMLRTSEPEKGAKLAEAMIKLVTGGEQIQARHLNRDFFKFYPQFKLTMSGNYRPTIAGTDEGIWRRVRLVPWTVSIPREKQDRHLIDRLRLEASGILNRLLDGLRDWCDNGLIEPEEVTKATAEYRSDSDPLGRFLSMCVQHDAGGRVQSSVLHAVYEAWCKSSGERAWTNRGLSLAMKERGFVSAQSNVVWWHDIKLIKRVDDFVDSQGHPVRYDNEGTTAQAEKVDDDAF